MVVGQATGEEVDERAWARLGGSLQLVGIIVIAYGLAQVLEEVRGDGPLETWRQLRSRARKRGRMLWRAGRRGATLWARKVANAWRRLTGRPVALTVNLGRARSVESALGPVISKAAGRVTPPWSGMILEDRVEHLYDSLRRLRDQVAALDGRQSSDWEALVGRIDQVQERVEHLQTGGLIKEAWGAVFLAAGTLFATFPGVFAASQLARALALGIATGAGAIWVNHADRRWWRV